MSKLDFPTQYCTLISVIIPPCIEPSRFINFVKQSHPWMLPACTILFTNAEYVTHVWQPLFRTQKNTS